MPTTSEWTSFRLLPAQERRAPRFLLSYRTLQGTTHFGKQGGALGFFLEIKPQLNAHFEFYSEYKRWNLGVIHVMSWFGCLFVFCTVVIHNEQCNVRLPPRKLAWQRLTDPKLFPHWFVCLDAKDESAQSGGSHGQKTSAVTMQSPRGKWRILSWSQFRSNVGLFEEVLELLDNTMPCTHWAGVSPLLLRSALFIPPPPPSAFPDSGRFVLVRVISLVWKDQNVRQTFD